MSIKYDPNRNLFAPQEELEIKTSFSKGNLATLYLGDCLDFLSQIPDQSIQLIITSPPYNIGKEYEKNQRLKNTFFSKVK
jgi:adenine-specific DNA-methyltransferase